MDPKAQIIFCGPHQMGDAQTGDEDEHGDD